MPFFNIHKEVFIIIKKFDRRPPSKADNTEINEMITDREIRLIDEEGEQAGIVSSKQALQIAIEKNLDLVKIAPLAKPPVCKLMDYGKYRYEQQKKEKESRKNQKVTNTKEVRISLNIEEHDLNTKAKNAIKFLSSGDKVKISLRLRGRELGHVDMAKDVVNKFYEAIGEEIATMDSKPKLEGKSVVTVLSPVN